MTSATVVEIAVIVPPTVKKHEVPGIGTLRQRQPNLPVVLGTTPVRDIKALIGTPEEFGSNITAHNPETIIERIIASPPPSADLETIDAISQAVVASRRASKNARQKDIILARDQKPARRHSKVWPKSWTREQRKPIRTYRRTQTHLGHSYPL